MFILWSTIISGLLMLGVCLGVNVNWGTYHWVTDNDRYGPTPIFHFVLRPSGYGWVNLEVGIAGRVLYGIWGIEES